ncbi:MAG: nucleotidyltransferase domain-containing protein [Lachnospiraceae bacterium]|nr:nucleotidyltransferase domain-containing protein [Lachnospiraceae bacterium]
MKTIEGIREAITPIAQEYGLKRVYLFGSYAKGTATEDSDVDLLIEKGEKLTLLGLSGIMLDAKDALNLQVDVVVRSDPETEFPKSIKGSEILLYEKQDMSNTCKTSSYGFSQGISTSALA